MTDYLEFEVNLGQVRITRGEVRAIVDDMLIYRFSYVGAARQLFTDRFADEILITFAVPQDQPQATHQYTAISFRDPGERNVIGVFITEGDDPHIDIVLGRRQRPAAELQQAIGRTEGLLPVAEVYGRPLNKFERENLAEITRRRDYMLPPLGGAQVIDDPDGDDGDGDYGDDPYEYDDDDDDDF